MEHEHYNTATLPNGLRIIHQESMSEVTYCGFAVNFGTRDEESTTPGMAHFIEHMLFKGTEHRKAWHILNRMESVGGNLNAYTNKEDTIIYCSFMRQHLSRAIELLCDIVLRSTFPEHEIAKEIEVILDEIDSYEDSPAELIFDEFDGLLFKGHPLGRNILGDSEHLLKYTPADAIPQYQKAYNLGNMVFFVLGNYDFKRIVRTVEKCTCDAEDTHTFTPCRTSPMPLLPCTQTINKDTHQAHIIIGSRSFAGNSEQLLAANMLTNILGGPGMNSRLNVVLREHYGLVYDVEASNTSFIDTGVFCVYFGCNKEDVDKCIELVRKEFRKIREGITPSQLRAAKRQSIGEVVVSSDNNENNAIGMGRTLLHYDKIITYQETFNKIEALETDLLNDVADQLLSDDALSTLIFYP